MKKILLSALAAITLAFAISSCSKTGATGATGPAGPLSTGTLSGYVSVLDQYGYKVQGDLSGVTIHISDSNNDSTVTNAAGFYSFTNLKTGVYNITYSKAGCSFINTYDHSFLGGGTILLNQSMSLIPSFSLFGANDTTEILNGDTGILARGIDTLNGLARSFIIFGGSSSSVSSSPGNYSFAYTNTIKAGTGTWSLFIPQQSLYDAGMAIGSTCYFIAYPYSTAQATYVDPTTGQTVYPALGTPTSVLTATTP